METPPTKTPSNFTVGLTALFTFLLALPFVVATNVVGWGLVGVAWNYAARAWGG